VPEKVSPFITKNGVPGFQRNGMHQISFDGIQGFAALAVTV
jgi:hypothetical protein